jgi:hypothetical protein
LISAISLPTHLGTTLSRYPLHSWPRQSKSVDPHNITNRARIFSIPQGNLTTLFQLTTPLHSREGIHSLSMATMTFNPQTPQSPSQFSPSTADPHSSMNSSMTSVTTASLPTPAHSVNNCDSSHDTTMIDADSPNKRKRLADDTGDQEQKKAHLEDPRRLGIENLHLDVGPKYLLLRTRKASLYSKHMRRYLPATPTFPCRAGPYTWSSCHLT